MRGGDGGGRGSRSGRGQEERKTCAMYCTEGVQHLNIPTLDNIYPGNLTNFTNHFLRSEHGHELSSHIFLAAIYIHTSKKEQVKGSRIYLWSRPLNCFPFLSNSVSASPVTHLFSMFASVSVFFPVRLRRATPLRDHFFCRSPT